MVKECYVCKREQYPGCGLSFHGFPKDETMRAKWINVLPHRKRRVTHTAMVCSRHFKKEDYEMKQWKRVLNKDSVPSLNFTQTRGYSLGENPDSIYFGTLCLPPQEDDEVNSSTRLNKGDEVASPCSDNESEIQDVEYLEDADSNNKPLDSSSEDDQNEVPTNISVKENVTSNEIVENEAFTQALARIDRIADELTRKDDEFDSFGKYIATTLRALPTKMAIVATKEIQKSLTDVQMKLVACQRREMERHYIKQYIGLDKSGS